MTLPTKETVEMLRSGYPNGTRVRLVKMNDLQAPPVGTEGTVVCVDEHCTIDNIHIERDLCFSYNRS